MTLDLGGVIRQLRSDHVRGGSGRVLTPPPLLQNCVGLEKKREIDSLSIYISPSGIKIITWSLNAYYTKWPHYCKFEVMCVTH